MACNITDNIELDCIDGLGGIKAAWVGTNVAITGVTSGTCGIVTGGTGTGTMFEFQFPKDTGSYTETTNIAPAAGTVFYQQDLALVFNKMDACKRDQLLLLAKNRDIKAIFQDSNDKYWLIGLTRGAQVSAGGAVTGVNPGDANQYTVTISGQEPESALELVSQSVFTGVTITNA
jgi:hypothetical protein